MADSLETTSAIDLVERLRQAANGLFPPSPLGDYGVCDEAADTITRLQAALKPFADCCEFIDESEDDDEWAKFRLVIKNYRDARDALRSSVGGE